jgi:hypothetical protein
MHNVKAVPRDSHHTKGKATTNNEEPAGDILGTESTLSVVTEGPTTTTATAAAATTSTTTEMSAESPSNNSASAWVGRKVDAIFSPVLSFLNGAASSSSSSCGGGGEEKDGDGEKKAENGNDSSEKENKLEKKMVGGDDVEDEVEKMVRFNFWHLRLDFISVFFMKKRAL